MLLLWLQNGRWDLTADHRYTLSSQTRAVVEKVDKPLTIQLLLDGSEVNAGFERLNQATHDLAAELAVVNNRCRLVRGAVPENMGLQPIIVHERNKKGQMVQTPIYPYAIVRYGNRYRVVNLLQNTIGLSGEENLNNSVEMLEYRFVEAINGLIHKDIRRVVFLEGHDELSERDVYDWCSELRKYYQIDRGVLGKEVGVLDDYQVVVVADPREALNESDKYILDQYIMQGGRVMWLLDGVRFSSEMLESNGLTPVIAEDWGLRDLLFRYGVRINPVLVQDLQCQVLPVEVSGSTEAQFQPMPWTYAPLLLTSDKSPITKNIAPVKSVMVSEVEAVGDEKTVSKQVLLATSTASRKTGVPAEVNLMDMTMAPEIFTMAYIPVGISLEGEFESLFAHRMPPEDIVESESCKVNKKSVRTKQIVVACGQLAVNEWQGQEALPVGYDRYMKTQFGNRDFLVNSVLWLADEQDLVQLRSKHVQLRLLNDKRSYKHKSKIQLISVVSPILLLAIVGSIVVGVRRKNYMR